MGSSATTVRIAVLTFRRPDDLVDALPRLLDQAAENTNPATVIDILVVDNDPEGSARGLVERLAGEQLTAHQVPLRYENEKVPGISAARNRALAVSEDRDLLVFIDDDERPSPSWLRLLLETYAEFGCAAVVGPVVSEYVVPLDAWLTAGRFFERRRRPTGSFVEVAATNNLLLDLRQVRDLGVQFDAEFGLSGGGDTMFTRTLVRRGGRMVWCDEAVVFDIVPANRTTREWVLQRAFRMGSSWSVTSLKVEPRRARRVLLRLELTGRGGLRVAGGSLRLMRGVAGRSLAHRARGQRTLARGLGMVTGAWGVRYSEYKRA